MTKAPKEKLLDFYAQHRRMPGYKEMMTLFGYKSKNAVYKLVNKLVEEGAVKKDRLGHLAPTHLLGEVPLLGLVEAGFPAVGEEEILDTLNLDEYLIKNRSDSYLLRVKGDSMIEAGIHEGDLVLAERREVARDGEIVIAEVDGGWTLKYFRERNGRVYLEPANKKYPLIKPQEFLKVAAVVRGVIRKYR